ncbi:MAG TPA: recombinase family protein [Mucilaginibacter sp.]|jgi:DNA invertase Pin-like site-specific DNA recombinase|nr:recombinase family protein [Mucilaginibacter sp.]
MNPNEGYKNVIKEIESGKYCGQYLIYNRRSTDEPENQKNSIKYQRSENSRFAFRERLSIAQISVEGFCVNGMISEKHSAFKENDDLLLKDNGFVQYRIERPKFYKLAQFLSKKYFKGVIVLCWDRICRNDSDKAVIQKIMKSGIDFRFVLATYDKTSSGALHMDIDGMFAAHHSRVTSEKVSLNIYFQREKGVCTYMAPVGYLNIGTMQEKPIDKVRAPIIKQMYELYAGGNWTLSEIRGWAIEQGFTMRPMRRKRTKAEKLQDEEDDVLVDIPKVSHLPTKDSIHKILTNPFYTGKVRGNNGEYVQSSSHKAIVADDLFNNVQKLLRRKNVSVKYSNKITYPLRGMFRCNACKRVYTPYIQKGNVYYGAHCLTGCSNDCKSFNYATIEQLVGGMMWNLCFTESELEEIASKSETDEIKFLESENVRLSEIRERKKRKIVEDLNYLDANKLNLLKTVVYSPEALLEEKEKLTDQLLQIQNEESSVGAPVKENIRNIVNLSELLKTLHLLYENAEPHEKEPIIKMVFSELRLFQNDLIYQCEKGFKALKGRFVECCALNTWLSELPYHSKEIQQSIAEIEEYVNKVSPS